MRRKLSDLPALVYLLLLKPSRESALRLRRKIQETNSGPALGLSPHELTFGFDRVVGARQDKADRKPLRQAQGFMNSIEGCSTGADIQNLAGKLRVADRDLCRDIEPGAEILLLASRQLAERCDWWLSR